MLADLFIVGPHSKVGHNQISYICIEAAYRMKGTEVPNPRRSSACDSGMRMLRQPGRAR